MHRKTASLTIHPVGKPSEFSRFIDIRILVKVIYENHFIAWQPWVQINNVVTIIRYAIVLQFAHAILVTKVNNRVNSLETIYLLRKGVWAFFEPPTPYVRAFSVHKVGENYYFLSHRPPLCPYVMYKWSLTWS